MPGTSARDRDIASLKANLLALERDSRSVFYSGSKPSTPKSPRKNTEKFKSAFRKWLSTEDLRSTSFSKGEDMKIDKVFKGNLKDVKSENKPDTAKTMKPRFRNLSLIDTDQVLKVLGDKKGSKVFKESKGSRLVVQRGSPAVTAPRGIEPKKETCLTQQQDAPKDILDGDINSFIDSVFEPIHGADENMELPQTSFTPIRPRRRLKSKEVTSSFDSGVCLFSGSDSAGDSPRLSRPIKALHAIRMSNDCSKSSEHTEQRARFKSDSILVLSNKVDEGYGDEEYMPCSNKSAPKGNEKSSSRKLCTSYSIDSTEIPKLKERREFSQPYCDDFENVKSSVRKTKSLDTTPVKSPQSPSSVNKRARRILPQVPGNPSNDIQKLVSRNDRNTANVRDSSHACSKNRNDICGPEIHGIIQDEENARTKQSRRRNTKTEKPLASNAANLTNSDAVQGPICSDEEIESDRTSPYVMWSSSDEEAVLNHSSQSRKKLSSHCRKGQDSNALLNTTSSPNSCLKHPSLLAISKCCDILHFRLEKRLFRELGCRFVKSVFNTTESDGGKKGAMSHKDGTKAPSPSRSPTGKSLVLGGQLSAFSPIQGNSEITGDPTLLSIHLSNSVPSYKGGLQEGDFVLEINEQLILGATMEEAEALVNCAQQYLDLVIGRFWNHKTVSDSQSKVKRGDPNTSSGDSKLSLSPAKAFPKDTDCTDLEKELNLLKIRFRDLEEEAATKDEKILQLCHLLERQSISSYTADGGYETEVVSVV